MSETPSTDEKRLELKIFIFLTVFFGTPAVGFTGQRSGLCHLVQSNFNRSTGSRLTQA